MIIEDLLQKCLKGRSERASITIREQMNLFILDMLDAQKKPKEIYHKWWHCDDREFGKDSLMSMIDKSLIEDYPVVIHNGFNRASHFHLTSAKSITLADIIQNTTHQSFVLGKNHLQYQLQRFNIINDIILAMLFAKYDVCSLTKEHITFSCLHTMFFYFRAYECDNWLIQVEDLKQIIPRIYKLDITHFEQIAVQYGFAYCSEIKRTRLSTKKKPECADDLIKCFEDGMTQTEKKEAIMKWWRCGERTARQYMSDFGLSNNKYTRSDYKESNLHINDAVEDITDNIKRSSNVITQAHDVTDYMDAQAERKSQIDKLKVDRLIATINFNNHVTNSRLDEQFESINKVLNGMTAKMIQSAPILDYRDKGDLDTIDS